jgi:hypothetical protein
MILHLTFEQWLAYGARKGYCTKQFCDTHDGPPMHESEELAWENGSDPCMHMVRLGSYDDWDIS